MEFRQNTSCIEVIEHEGKSLKIASCNDLPEDLLQFARSPQHGVSAPGANRHQFHFWIGRKFNSVSFCEPLYELAPPKIHLHGEGTEAPRPTPRSLPHRCGPEETLGPLLFPLQEAPSRRNRP